MTDGYAPGQKLTFTQDKWYFLQAQGSAVFNGDEMDLFQSPACIEELGRDVVGRYRWSLNTDILKFTVLNDDPCERKSIFDSSTFKFLRSL